MDRSHTSSRAAADGKAGSLPPLRYTLGGNKAVGHPAPPKKPRSRRLAVRHKVSGTNRRVRGA